MALRSRERRGVLEITREIAQAEGPYGRKALDYMRDKNVFPRDLLDSAGRIWRSRSS